MKHVVSACLRWAHQGALFLFQNLINKMWLGVPSQDKMEIRSCLPKLLLAQHKTLPYFIRNKLCKVIVDIGRQDWPMFYHDFFTNILQVRSFWRYFFCHLILVAQVTLKSFGFHHIKSPAECCWDVRGLIQKTRRYIWGALAEMLPLVRMSLVWNAASSGEAWAWLAAHCCKHCLLVECFVSNSPNNHHSWLTVWL